MGMTVAWGLSVSTLITLVIVPVVYRAEAGFSGSHYCGQDSHSSFPAEDRVVDQHDTVLDNDPHQHNQADQCHNAQWGLCDCQSQNYTVSAVVGKGAAMSDIVTAARNQLKEMDIPSDVSWQLGGTYEDQMDTFFDLTILMVLIIILVFIVMAAQFESLTDPFVIMFSIPFAFTGIILEAVEPLIRLRKAIAAVVIFNPLIASFSRSKST